MTNASPLASSADGGAKIASAGDYIALMKPRVMSLVVFTALVGYVAAPGANDIVLGFAAILAIAAGAGAAGAFNMWFDADIDAVMSRTRTRPIPAGRVAKEDALGLGVALALLAVVTMTLAGGALAAGLLAFTIGFYVAIYTMWLKRATPQNIVIGGLSGALPPAIAWAAKTGSLSIEPLILVAIIFMWTPPHFWSLALIKSEDYARAGVPMLPVTHGPLVTRAHILAYTLLLAPLGLAPYFMGFAGPIYLAVASLGGAVFVALAWALARRGAPKVAGVTFVFSIVYLFALFAALLAERLMGMAR